MCVCAGRSEWGYEMFWGVRGCFKAGMGYLSAEGLTPYFKNSNFMGKGRQDQGRYQGIFLIRFSMLKHVFVLLLTYGIGAVSSNFAATNPFFPEISEETWTDAFNELSVGREEQGQDLLERVTLLDECSKHTTCGSCAAASSLFTSCRWCPKFGDVSCHVVGSSSNTCESDEQVRKVKKDKPDRHDESKS